MRILNKHILLHLCTFWIKFLIQNLAHDYATVDNGRLVDRFVTCIMKIQCHCNVRDCCPR